MLFTRIKKEQQFLHNLPSSPGIYRFYAGDNEILYVGASSNLQKRVNQHFINLTNENLKQRSIRRFTKFIEYFCYDTVASAFEAEKIEIWTHKPKYNRRSMTTKTFSYLVVRKSPYLHLCCLPTSNNKKIKNDDEIYCLNMHYKKVQNHLETIRKLIPFCLPSSVCWDHHLGLCMNLCRNNSSIVNDHGFAQIEYVIQAVSGTKCTLISKWERNLVEYVENLEFEAAKKLSDALNSIKEIKSKFCGTGFLNRKEYSDERYFKNPSNIFQNLNSISDSNLR